MTQALVGLGSNIGEREQYFLAAIAALDEIDGKCVLSGLYETLPVGGPEGQHLYLNAVCSLAISKSPEEVLTELLEIEVHLGRTRLVKNGPRTMDLDLLWVDGEVINSEVLALPHPRMASRGFVLAPLYELRPDIVLQLRPDVYLQLNSLGDLREGQEVLSGVWYKGLLLR